MAELTDVELLSRLEIALAPPPSRPDDNALAQLRATLQELETEFEPVDIAAAAERRNNRHGTSGLRSRRGARSTFVAASAIAFALSAGVAAAAVATNTLPGPTRSFAYDLGLPVTSPGLHGAQQSAAALQQSILMNDLPQQKVLGRRLVSELKTLDPSDLSQIRASADTLLGEAGITLPTLSQTSGSSTPTVTTPSVSVPTVTVSGVTVPSATIPSVSVPTITTPVITVPTVPTVPAVTVPSVSIPKVTIPNIPLPVATIPIVHVPLLP